LSLKFRHNSNELPAWVVSSLNSYQKIATRILEGILNFPKSWLYKVALNITKNKINIKKHRNEKIEDTHLHETSCYSLEEKLLESEQYQVILTYLQKLSKKEKILLLLYQDGLSYSEMAEITHIKKTSIGKMLSRAIHKLEHYIKEEERDEMPQQATSVTVSG